MLRNRAWLRHAMRAIDLTLFAGHETDCTITWLRWRPKATVYAWYDLERRLISLDRRLAWPAVPDHVVVGVIHHEMLHHRLGLEHDERFALAERRYPSHTEYALWDAYEWHNVVLSLGRPDSRLIR